MSDSILNGSEFQEEFHVCPNGDVEACDYCKLVNRLEILYRSFLLKNQIEEVEHIGECLESVRSCRRSVDSLKCHLSRFDFSEEVQHNGYRTFVLLTKFTVSNTLNIVEDINRLGRSYSVTRHPVLHEKFVDWAKILRFLNVILQCLYEFARSSSTNCLFTSNKPVITKLLSFTNERGNLVGFNGRHSGYQFAQSLRVPLQLIGCMMATFSNIYKTNDLFKHALMLPQDFLYYWQNPKERAERIAEVCATDTLNFFKSFWRVQENEFLVILQNCLGEPVEQNLVMYIPPTKLTVLSILSNTALTILPPSEYLGIQPLMVRLISHKTRIGSAGSGRQKIVEGLSKTLIIHCHGGGFVAQSSSSHLIYLTHWAKGLEVPILSIDYSLAPEASYPRAVHEAFYAYIWALKNAHLLGCTAERIVFAGDSAGGQLLTTVVILCIELGIRVPDALFLAYAPQLMETAISPARLLSLADALLPYHALSACMDAYLGMNFELKLADLPGCFVEGGWESRENNIENCSRKLEISKLEELSNFQGDYHLSPLLASNDILRKFPPTSLATSNFDPVLDDCVEFAKRLREVGVPITLDVFHGIPHGFLNFGKISEECFQATNTCLHRLKDLI